MNGHARLVAALEAAAPGPPAGGDRDTRQRDALAAGLARLADVVHRQTQRPLAAGQPVRSEEGYSIMERLVRMAMAEASGVGEWGTPEYARRFFEASCRLLDALVRAQGQVGEARDSEGHARLVAAWLAAAREGGR